jgi:hypothetical protein
MHRCQNSFKKIPSNWWVVSVGSNSFQEISYTGKPQVVSSYIISNLWTCLNQKKQGLSQNLDHGLIGSMHFCCTNTPDHIYQVKILNNCASFGAITLSITTFSITTLSLMALYVKLSITTLSIIGLCVTLGINDTDNNWHSA